MCLSFSSSKYIHDTIKYIEEHLARKVGILPPKAETPWSTGHIPENDISPESSATGTAYF